MKNKMLSSPYAPVDSRELESYIRNIADSTRLSPEDEMALGIAWHDNRDTDARQKLINSNLRLVIMVAKKYANRGVPLDELVAEGNIGLIHAVDHFDPRAGARLGTYAMYWIQNSISELFIRASGRMRLSRSARMDSKRLDAAAEAFRLEHGRPADDNELAAALEWTSERVREVRALMPARSRPLPLGTENSPEIAAAETPERTADPERLGRLRQMLGTLSPQERQAIELRFGLSDGRAHSATEVAKIMQAAPRAIRIRLETAIRKLSRLAAQFTGSSDPGSLSALMA